MLSNNSQSVHHHLDDGVTIVIVTYNSEETIGACLKSLANNTRAHDHVVLIDNASWDRTCELIRPYTETDKRFTLHYNSKNVGYAKAVNQGANCGEHPYIVFLNPDTIVTPHWLERLIYHLKPDKHAAVGPISNYVAGMQKLEYYLPDLPENNSKIDVLLNALWQNNQRQSVQTNLLIGFCLMVKRKLFNDIGGMDNDLFLGNDDLDLSWRLCRAGYQLVVAKDTLVFHKGQASFVSEPEKLTNSLVQESTDYLSYKLLRYYGVTNRPSPEELWGIDWFQPKTVFKENLPLTSITILTFNQLYYTRQCVESIYKYTLSPYELIVVDNGSTDGTLDYLSSLEREQTACIRIKIIANPINKGFAKGCNQGLAESRGQYLLLLNNDVVVTPGWLPKLMLPLKQAQVGFSGPMSNYVSGQQLVENVSYNIKNLDGLEKFAKIHAQQNAGQIILNRRLVGFCMLIKQDLIKKVGGFDEEFQIGNFEDDDFCLRAYLSGYKGAIAKDCFVHHFGNQSFVGNNIDFNERLRKNWNLFKLKWGIAQETPYTAKYSVPISTVSFDSDRHYIALKKSSHQQEDGNTSNSSGIAAQQTTKIKRTHNKGDLPGGKSMLILDQVLETIKEELSPEQKDVSIWILERIIENAPEHGGAHHELGMLYFEQEKLGRAELHLQRAVRFSPGEKNFFKDIGDFYHVVQKDNAKALEFYEKAIELSPYDGNLLLTAAHLSTAEKKFERANAYYQRVLEIEPDNQDARSCFQKLKDWTDTDTDKESIETLYRKAQSQMQSGNKQAATETLKGLLESCPDHALAHNDYAVLSYEAGDMDFALHHYQKAVEINPENNLFLKNLSDFYWCEKKNAKAAMELNVQVLGSDPLDVETLLSCAQICMAHGQNIDAREFINRARVINPIDNTVDELEKRLDTHQDQMSCTSEKESLYEAANKMAGEGDLEGAVKVLTKSVSENPQDAVAYNSLGVLYFELGCKEDALTCYRKAVDLEPEQEVYVKNLADFYLMERGEAENAMQLYLSVLRDNPHDLDCLIATGLICISMDKLEDAKVFIERALEVDPTNQRANQLLQHLNGYRYNVPGADVGKRSCSQDEELNAAG